MIERVFDPDIVNHFANHPDIRPFIGGDVTAPLDLSQVVADRQNYCFFGEHGGFVATWSAPQTYEVHTLITPQGRGLWAFRAAQAAIAALPDARLWTRVPPDAPHIKAFTLRAGFVPAGVHRADFGAGAVDYSIFERRASCQQQAQS